MRRVRISLPSIASDIVERDCKEGSQLGPESPEKERSKSNWVRTENKLAYEWWGVVYPDETEGLSWISDEIEVVDVVGHPECWC